MTPQNLGSLLAAIVLAQLLSVAAHEAAGPGRTFGPAALNVPAVLDVDEAKAWLVAGLKELDAAGALQDPELGCWESESDGDR